MTRIIPVMRVFDYAKTIEFYMDWLGFTKEWEYYPENCPFYMRVSIRGIALDLSEHHGECSPGARVSIDDFEGLEAYHRGLIAKQYRYMRPGLETQDWDPNIRTMTVIDPFYNRIIFNEPIAGD